MRKSLILLLTFVSIISASVQKMEYSINWELSNPFRFFQNKKDFEKIKTVYDVAVIEFKKGKYKNIGHALERELQKQEKFYKTNGWASKFAIDYNKTTCWNNKSKLYNNSECNDYINAKKYNIKLWLENIDPSLKCKWFYENKQLKQESCSKVYLDLDSSKMKHLIKVKIDSLNYKTSIKINKIKDLLIVGLGDSFASGEGNPDIPATVSGIKANKDVFFVESRYLPRKDTKNSYAKWLDRRCHRSFYSYQFKTALQLALKNPKQAITFISFSCTGATTNNIIDKNKSAKENLTNVEPNDFDDVSYLDLLENKNRLNKRRSIVAPQLELLIKTLKGKRKIDLLLLSTGGNDIGFSKYVMNILINNTIADLVTKTPNLKTAYEVKEILGKNYNRLNEEIKKRKLLKNNEVKRIVLTAYPNIVKDENAMLCKELKESTLEIPFGKSKGINRALKIQNTHEYLIEPLYKIQKNLTTILEWSFVDTHLPLYSTHGFCAKKQGDKYRIPSKKSKDDLWEPFSPSEYLKYNEKQRWVNVPLDSALKINLTKKTFLGDIDFGFTDESSGIMHPTAEGLAVTANENVELICKNKIIECK